MLRESLCAARNGFFKMGLNDAKYLAFDGISTPEGVPVWSISVDPACVRLATKLMRSHLLDAWKNGTGLISGDKYVAVAQMPDAIDVPSLSVLKVVDGKLCIPPDVRQRWLADPIRSLEWKKVVGKFDQHHGQSSTLSPPVAVQADAVVTSESAAVPEGEGQCVPPEWADEPTTLEDMVKKYTVASTFALSEGGLVAKVVDGPKLFIAAPVADSFGTESPLLCHGAGAWLLDAKAEKAMKESSL